MAIALGNSAFDSTGSLPRDTSLTTFDLTTDASSVPDEVYLAVFIGEGVEAVPAPTGWTALGNQVYQPFWGMMRWYKTVNDGRTIDWTWSWGDPRKAAVYVWTVRPEGGEVFDEAGAHGTHGPNPDLSGDYDFGINDDDYQVALLPAHPVGVAGLDEGYSAVHFEALLDGFLTFPYGIWTPPSRGSDEYLASESFSMDESGVHVNFYVWTYLDQSDLDLGDVNFKTYPFSPFDDEVQEGAVGDATVSTALISRAVLAFADPVPPEPRDVAPGFIKPDARRRLDISELPYQVTHMDVEDIFDA